MKPPEMPKKAAEQDAGQSTLAELTTSPEFAWSVLESMPTEAVVVFDHELRIVAAAGQVLRERDFEPERVIGSCLSEVIDPPVYERYRPHYESALAGEVTSLEAETADGRNVFVSTFSPLRTSQGVVIGGVGFTRDITDARRAQDALEASEAHYRALTEDSTDLIARLAPDGTIKYVSPASETLSGYTSEELVGRPMYEFFHPDDVADLAETHQRMLEATEPITISYRMKRKRGDYVFIESTVRPVRDAEGNLTDFHTVTRDVTERREAEEIQQRFETAFSDAPIGMALVGLDGRFQRVNRALCEITGYPRERLLELTFQEITHPDDLDADLASLEQLLAGTVDRYSMEKRYFTATDNLIWVNLSVSMVSDPDGNPLHFISQIEDISDRKRLEEQLHWLADHDSLTRLWNRRRFDEELHRQVSRCQRYAERAALFLVDLDDFKPVNDRYGHKAGDDLLIAIAAALKTRLRDTDSIARIGGDEFAAVAVNVSPDQAASIAQSLAEVVSETAIDVDGQSVCVGASVGVALIDDRPDLDHDIFVRADMDMYRAKGRKANPDLARL